LIVDDLLIKIISKPKELDKYEIEKDFEQDKDKQVL